MGKSTTSRVLQTLLARAPERRRVDLVTTDGFLLPNAELERRGLMQRKGFPESYDTPRLVVEAGKPFEIIFENTDFMPHNVVIVRPGSREKVGEGLGVAEHFDGDGRRRAPLVQGAGRRQPPGHLHCLIVAAVLIEIDGVAERLGRLEHLERRFGHR